MASAYEKKIRSIQFAGDWRKPKHLETFAVDESQRKEAEIRAAKLGVPTDYDGIGRPIILNADHEREFLQKVEGAFDKDAGYRGATPQNYKGDGKEWKRRKQRQQQALNQRQRQA